MSPGELALTNFDTLRLEEITSRGIRISSNQVPGLHCVCVCVRLFMIFIPWQHSCSKNDVKSSGMSDNCLQYALRATRCC